MNFDIFSALGAIGTLLGAFATWQSFRFEKELKRMQELRLDLSIESTTYENIPIGGIWQTTTYAITNLSMTPTLVKSAQIAIKGKNYELRINDGLVLEPYIKAALKCSFSCSRFEILDGHDPATLTIQTDRKTLDFELSSSDFMYSFRGCITSET